MSVDAPNPFADDPDRREIWDMLMRRDFEAFLAQDWSMVEHDFDRDAFFAIDAAQQANPRGWRIGYATLDNYRDEWLRQAQAFALVELAGKEKLAFFYEAVRLDQIEITGVRAIAHKLFAGEATTSTGQIITLRWQTLYQLARRADGWRIVGFIGYLPNPMP